MTTLQTLPAGPVNPAQQVYDIHGRYADYSAPSDLELLDVISLLGTATSIVAPPASALAIGAGAVGSVAGVASEIKKLVGGRPMNGPGENFYSQLAISSQPTTPPNTGPLAAVGRFFGNLLPGEQPWLGERPTISPGIGRIPIIGDILQAGSALIPGHQPWLGEAAPGYMGMSRTDAQALQAQQFDPLGPGPMAPGGVANVPGLIKSWTTGNGQVFYMFQHRSPKGYISNRIGTFKSNGVWVQWKPYKPLCLGKNPSPAKAKKVAKALEKSVKSTAKTASILGWKLSRR